jgi:hypothetical protein
MGRPCAQYPCSRPSLNRVRRIRKRLVGALPSRRAPHRPGAAQEWLRRRAGEPQQRDPRARRRPRYRARPAPEARLVGIRWWSGPSGAAPASVRPITRRWISLVPSKIVYSLASRYHFRRGGRGRSRGRRRPGRRARWRGPQTRHIRKRSEPQMLACLCAQRDSNSHAAYAGQGPQPWDLAARSVRQRLVTGRMMSGVPRISDMWVPPLHKPGAPRSAARRATHGFPRAGST